MNKILLIALFSTLTIFAQSTKYGWLAKESWSLGIGATYPKYTSSSLSLKKEDGYGGYIVLQRNFTEHVGVRLKGNYLHITGLANVNNVESSVVNDVIAGNFAMLYYFVPCEPISPYLHIGIGGFLSDISNSPEVTFNNDQKFDYQFGLGLGAEWRIGENLKLKTELSHYTPASSHFDGTFGTQNGGILGGIQDAYMTFDLGVTYYFAYEEKSNICDIYEGVSKAEIDYEKIEDIVKKYQTEPIIIDYNRIEDIVKKHSTGQGMIAEGAGSWVLIGVNFDLDSDRLMPESLPILYNAASILIANPNINVEIQGHTDDTGSEVYNQELSVKRAQTVYNFLVAKGVTKERLTISGYGESKPIMDNSTEQGKELNRRIEFKIIK